MEGKNEQPKGEKDGSATKERRKERERDIRKEETKRQKHDRR